MKDVRRFAKGLAVVLGFLFVAFLLPLDYAFSILLGCIAAMVVVLVLRLTLKL